MTCNSQKTVLIADDDQDFLMILEKRLERLGLDVRTATSGKEALEAAVESLPDLFCLDANMPAGGGLAVCEVLALDDEASQIPVIIITGRKDPEIIRRCHNMCAYYLCKSDQLWKSLDCVVHELLDVENQSDPAKRTAEPAPEPKGPQSRRSPKQ